VVEETNRIFVMHYTAGLFERCFQLAHVVEETTNPSPNELEKWIILGLFINCSQPLICAKNAIVN
jgi:linoleoyl-CoA desaturase